MKKIYKVCIIIVIAIVCVLSVVFFWKRGKTESVFNDKIKHELAVADFKEGAEYQFAGIPLGISLDELKEMVPYSLYEDPIRPTTDLHATESYLLLGKTTDAVYKFEDDKLTEVQLVFRSNENAVEQFDSIVAEATDLFGPESEKIEDTLTVDLGYIWKTENTLLEITTYKVSGRNVMNIFIRTTVEGDSANESLTGEDTVNTEATSVTENNENTEGLKEFKLADLKQGDEYQIDLIPLSTSWYEVKPWAAADGLQMIMQEGSSEYDYSADWKYIWSEEEYLLEGKCFNAVYDFLHDELVAVNLKFVSEENVADYFEAYVTELTKQFGTESDRMEDSKTGEVSYIWQTDNTRLQITLEKLNDSKKDLTFSIGYTEKELDRILAENVKESRELTLDNLKQDQEYQFDAVAWKASVEEVETLLDGKLKNVSLEAPKDYVFYDFKDVVYVLDGHEAKASFEFQSGELVYVDFEFGDLEDPKAFFEEIVSVFRDTYGTETAGIQNETAGIIGYRWRTDNSQLAISFSEKSEAQITIFLASLK